MDKILLSAIGARQTGKSTLLNLIKERLSDRFDFEELPNPHALKVQIKKGGGKPKKDESWYTHLDNKLKSERKEKKNGDF